MITQIFTNKTQDDLQQILLDPNLRQVTIHDIKYTAILDDDGRIIPRVEVRYLPNAESQVILPSQSDRLQAVELIIDLEMMEGEQ